MDKGKRGKNDMDVDVAEKDAEKDYVCTPCTGQGAEDDQLNTMKGGGGKGASGAPFQGKCGFCGAWGHKRSDCRKYTAHLQAK